MFKSRMAKKVPDDMESFPQNPPWTMFFDGQLFQEYDKFMKTKDFSKILLNTKVRLGTNLHNPEVVKSAYVLDDDHWNKEHEVNQIGNNYQYVSEDYYRRDTEDERRRARRTRAFIILGLVIMAALAFGTALVIHYIIITPLEERNPNVEERNPNKIVNVSISGNTTDSIMTDFAQTTPLDIDEHKDDELLKGSSRDNLDQVHDNGHTLHNDGKTSDHSPKPTATKSTTAQTMATQTNSYLLNLHPDTSNTESVPITSELKTIKPYTSTMYIDHMAFFGIDELKTTTQAMTSSSSEDDFIYYYDVETTTKHSATADDLTTSSIQENLQTKAENVLRNDTRTLPTMTTLDYKPSANMVEEVVNNTTEKQQTSTSINVQEDATIPYTTDTTLVSRPMETPVTSYMSTQESVTTIPITSDAQKKLTTASSREHTVEMSDVTAYTFDKAKLLCSVKHAVKWQSLSVRVNQTWRRLEVTLFPSGAINWSRAKKNRHGVSYDIVNRTDGTGSNITLSLVINDVQCRDANTYICSLKSSIDDRTANGRLIVVGKPSNKISLILGPSVIEDRAFRITAAWQGGYPIPWANMSWTALDSNNKSYNLADYGEYRDYEVHEDHKFCQTTLKSSIVVFPRIHLNDTTVIVRPNIATKRYFVDNSMEKYLKQVLPGQDKILVIPLNYCQNGKTDMSIPHPYTPCTKFVRCLPGDMVIQQCPRGTCFYERKQECG